MVAAIFSAVQPRLAEPAGQHRALLALGRRDRQQAADDAGHREAHERHVHEDMSQEMAGESPSTLAASARRRGRAAELVATTTRDYQPMRQAA
jgi:hypothetical protein